MQITFEGNPPGSDEVAFVGHDDDCSLVLLIVLQVVQKIDGEVERSSVCDRVAHDERLDVCVIHPRLEKDT